MQDEQFDSHHDSGAYEPGVCSCCGRAAFDFEELDDGTIRVYFADAGLKIEDDYRGWCREQMRASTRWLVEHPELAEDDDRVISLLASLQCALERMGEQVGATEPAVGPRQVLERLVAEGYRRRAPTTVHVRPLPRNREPRRRSAGARRARARSPGRQADDDPEPELVQFPLVGIAR